MILKRINAWIDRTSRRAKRQEIAEEIAINLTVKKRSEPQETEFVWESSDSRYLNPFTRSIDTLQALLSLERRVRHNLNDEGLYPASVVANLANGELKVTIRFNL